MCEVIRQAIEDEQQLQDASVLEDKEFFIDDVCSISFHIPYMASLGPRTCHITLMFVQLRMIFPVITKKLGKCSKCIAF